VESVPLNKTIVIGGAHFGCHHRQKLELADLGNSQRDLDRLDLFFVQAEVVTQGTNETMRDLAFVRIGPLEGGARLGRAADELCAVQDLMAPNTDCHDQSRIIPASVTYVMRLDRWRTAIDAFPMVPMKDMLAQNSPFRTR